MSATKEDTIESLRKRIELLEAALSKPSSSVKWDNEVITVGTLTLDEGKSFSGTFYKTDADKGTLAIYMENGGSSKPGTLKIGVKLSDDKEILTLARIHKTKGHDFYISKAKMTSPPNIQYGVVRTPGSHNEAAHKALGYPGVKSPVIRVNCDEDDRWIEPDANLLERCHSPTM